MAVVSSEGAFFTILAGGYTTNGAANVDVVLKGYSGEPVKVERVGRPGERIDRASLSLCLAVQPEMLADFLSDPTLTGRGMASRFLAAMPESRVGDRATLGIPPSPELQERFAARLEAILRAKEEIVLTLTPEAFAAYDAWFREVERSLKPGGELADLGQGWGGKLCGNTIRLAGLITLSREDRREISGDAMSKAIRMAKWFRDQALRLMGGENGLSPEANEALGWLVRRGEAEISATQVKNILRKRKPFPRAESVDLALDELETNRFIRRFTVQGNEVTGRPRGLMIQLHPGLLAKKGGGRE